MLFFVLLACSQPTMDTSAVREEQGVIPDSSEQHFVLSSMLYLNKKGRLFLWDKQRQEERWRLENPNDPVWQDMRFSLDAKSLWHNETDVVDHDPMRSFLVQVNAAGEELQRWATPGTHHSFDLIEEDLLVSLEHDIRVVEPHGKVAGDSIVLYRNGEREQLLSAFDVLEAAPVTQMWNNGFLPDAKDWTHANAVRWLPEQEELLVTLPGLNALWLLSLDGTLTGVCLGKGVDAEPYRQHPYWQQNPFPIWEGGSFDLPHGASMDSEGRIWVLSNGLGNDSDSLAQGWERIGDRLELLFEAPIPIEGAHSAGLGSVEYQPSSDSVLINWGILGVMEERDRDSLQQEWLFQSNIQEVLGISRGVSSQAVEVFLAAE